MDSTPNIVVPFDGMLRVVHAFLLEHNLAGAARALESEAGVSSSAESDDVAFVRELVMDGKWQRVEAVCNVLSTAKGIDYDGVLFEVRKQRFLEVLATKLSGEGASAVSLGDADGSVTSVVQALRAIEPVCPSKVAFNSLCYALTLSSINDHPQLTDWTVALGRHRCFEAVRKEFHKLFPPSSPSPSQGTSGAAGKLGDGSVPPCSLERIFAQAGAAQALQRAVADPRLVASLSSAQRLRFDPTRTSGVEVPTASTALPIGSSFSANGRRAGQSALSNATSLAEVAGRLLQAQPAVQPLPYAIPLPAGRKPVRNASNGPASSDEPLSMTTSAVSRMGVGSGSLRASFGGAGHHGGGAGGVSSHGRPATAHPGGRRASSGSSISAVFTHGGPLFSDEPAVSSSSSSGRPKTALGISASASGAAATAPSLEFHADMASSLAALATTPTNAANGATGPGAAGLSSTLGLTGEELGSLQDMVRRSMAGLPLALPPPAHESNGSAGTAAPPRATAEPAAPSSAGSPTAAAGASTPAHNRRSSTASSAVPPVAAAGSSRPATAVAAAGISSDSASSSASIVRSSLSLLSGAGAAAALTRDTSPPVPTRPQRARTASESRPMTAGGVMEQALGTDRSSGSSGLEPGVRASSSSSSGRPDRAKRPAVAWEVPVAGPPTAPVSYEGEILSETMGPYRNANGHAMSGPGAEADSTSITASGDQPAGQVAVQGVVMTPTRRPQGPVDGTSPALAGRGRFISMDAAQSSEGKQQDADEDAGAGQALSLSRLADTDLLLSPASAVAGAGHASMANSMGNTVASHGLVLLSPDTAPGGPGRLDHSHALFSTAGPSAPQLRAAGTGPLALASAGASNVPIGAATAAPQSLSASLTSMAGLASSLGVAAAVLEGGQTKSSTAAGGTGLAVPALAAAGLSQSAVPATPIPSASSAATDAGVSPASKWTQAKAGPSRPQTAQGPIATTGGAPSASVGAAAGVSTALVPATPTRMILTRAGVMPAATAPAATPANVINGQPGPLQQVTDSVHSAAFAAAAAAAAVQAMLHTGLTGAAVPSTAGVQRPVIASPPRSSGSGPPSAHGFGGGSSITAAAGPGHGSGASAGVTPGPAVTFTPSRQGSGTSTAMTGTSVLAAVSAAKPSSSMPDSGLSSPSLTTPRRVRREDLQPAATGYAPKAEAILALAVHSADSNLNANSGFKQQQALLVPSVSTPALASPPPTARRVPKADGSSAAVSAAEPVAAASSAVRGGVGSPTRSRTMVTGPFFAPPPEQSQPREASQASRIPRAHHPSNRVPVVMEADEREYEGAGVKAQSQEIFKLKDRGQEGKDDLEEAKDAGEDEDRVASVASRLSAAAGIPSPSTPSKSQGSGAAAVSGPLGFTSPLPAPGAAVVALPMEASRYTVGVNNITTATAGANNTTAGNVTMTDDVTACTMDTTAADGPAATASLQPQQRSVPPVDPSQVPLPATPAGRELGYTRVGGQSMIGLGQSTLGLGQSLAVLGSQSMAGFSTAVGPASSTVVEASAAVAVDGNVDADATGTATAETSLSSSILDHSLVEALQGSGAGAAGGSAPATVASAPVAQAIGGPNAVGSAFGPPRTPARAQGAPSSTAVVAATPSSAASTSLAGGRGAATVHSDGLPSWLTASLAAQGCRVTDSGTFVTAIPGAAGLGAASSPVRGYGLGSTMGGMGAGLPSFGLNPIAVFKDSEPIRALAWSPAAGTGADNNSDTTETAASNDGLLAIGTNSRNLNLCSAPVSAVREALANCGLTGLPRGLLTDGREVGLYGQSGGYGADSLGPGAAARNGSDQALLDPETGLPLLSVDHVWQGHHVGSVYAIAWAANGPAGGDLLATGSNDVTVRVARFARSADGGVDDDLCTSSSLVVPTELGTVRDVCWLGAGGAGTSVPLLAAVGGGDHAVRLWDVSAYATSPMAGLCGPAPATVRPPRAPLLTLAGHKGIVHGIRPWGDDGRHLVTASADGCVKLWDVRAGSRAAAVSLCLSTNGSIAVPGTALPASAPSGTGAAAPVELHSLAVRTGYGGSVPKELAVGTKDGHVAVLDIHAGRILVSNKVHSGEVRSVDALGPLLLSASFDGSIALSATVLGSGPQGSNGLGGRGGAAGPAVPNLVVLGSRTDHVDKTLCAKWHPSLPLLVTSSADRTALVWSLQA